MYDFLEYTAAKIANWRISFNMFEHPHSKTSYCLSLSPSVSLSMASCSTHEQLEAADDMCSLAFVPLGLRILEVSRQHTLLPMLELYAFTWQRLLEVL